MPSPCFLFQEDFAFNMQVYNYLTLCRLSTLFLTISASAMTPAGINPIVDVGTFGAKGNGTNDDTSAVLAALKSETNIHFPAGSYVINNSGGPALISNFSSALVFDSGATLLLTSSTQLGFQFTGGSNAKFIRISTAYKTLPTLRLPGSVLSFTNTNNTYLWGAVVNGSPGGGISFQSCVGPVVLNTTISNTVADGLFFANSQAAVIDGVTTNNTGDDGLAIHNFVNAPQESNGYATNITVSNSKARGISCSGCMNLDISHFTVNNTSAQGVQIDLDTVSQSYTPTNVVIRNGTVENAGKLTPVAGNQFGIELDNSVNVRIADVVVQNSAGRGISVSAPTGSTVFENVQVTGTGEGGAGFDLQGQSITMTDSSAANTSAQCIAITYSTTVTVNNVTGTNCNQSGGLNRAVDLEVIKLLAGSGIKIVDSQSVATGFMYYDWSVTSGFIGSVSYSISHGAFSFSSTSPGVQVNTLTNMGS